jgi:hypothetical protein
LQPFACETFTEKKAEEIGRILKLSRGKTVRVLLPVGVPETGFPQKEKQPFDQRAWFNCYGGSIFRDVYND